MGGAMTRWILCALLVLSGSATAVAVVTMPSASAAGSGRILIVGDSITQGSSGDYTWRYRLWDEHQSTDPGYTFVGPRTDLHDNA